MSAVLTIARLAVVRLLRERANLFFVFVFPLLLVLLIGLSFGGAGSVSILVVGDAADDQVASVSDTIDASDGLRARVITSPDVALDALARGRADGVVILPAGFANGLRTGQPQEIQVSLRDTAAAARPAVDAALAAVVGPHRAAALARQLGVSDAGAIGLAQADLPRAMAIQVSTVGGEDDPAGFANLGQFDLGASSQLVLFIFITTLSGATRLVESRELGTTRRMLATPTSPRQVVAGEALGRFSVALFQGAWVVLGSIVMFQVNWGDPVAALSVIASFSMVSAAASLLLGAVATNVNQASGLSTLLGLTLAALGGSMAPLDIFSDNLRRVAHLTPHAWANDAFAELTRRDGGLLDVLPELGVLLGFAVVLGALATWRLQAAITKD